MGEKVLSIPELLRKFPDDAAAEAWFVEQRWPDGVACPHCGDTNINSDTSHPKMAYRCRGCKKFFSVKTKSVMHGSNLGYQVWAVAIYLFNTHAKGVSSLQLHRELGITQKSAWHLAHRLRETWNEKQPPFAGQVEVDETYVGGRERNKHALKKARKGRGTVGKVAVAGARERDTGRIHAHPVGNTDRETLTRFVTENTDDNAIVYTDEHAGYDEIPRHHYTVNHSAGIYTEGPIHTNGIESVWASLKRAHKGTYHQWSRKHLHRYVNECGGRLNVSVQGAPCACICCMTGVL